MTNITPIQERAPQDFDAIVRNSNLSDLERPTTTFKATVEDVEVVSLAKPVSTDATSYASRLLLDSPQFDRSDMFLLPGVDGIKQRREVDDVTGDEYTYFEDRQSNR